MGSQSTQMQPTAHMFFFVAVFFCWEGGYKKWVAACYASRHIVVASWSGVLFLRC